MTDSDCEFTDRNDRGLTSRTLCDQTATISDVAGIQRIGRPRPKLFRALGECELPLQVEVDGNPCQLLEVFKHDSWAATGLYCSRERKIVCKFHRKQSILPIPMAWFGRWMARHELAILRRLADVQGTPQPAEQVSVAGVPQRNVSCRNYVEGHPLRRNESVGVQFFDQLRTLLDEMHCRDMAYVDLHKPENIIVGADGRPYLIDFQISFALSPGWLRRLWPLRVTLRILQSSDRYHLSKHVVRWRNPDLPESERAVLYARPWWIRLHRIVAVPFRSLRRRMLVWLGIRRGKGRAHSEHQPEQAVRFEQCRLNADIHVRHGQNEESATFEERAPSV